MRWKLLAGNVIAVLLVGVLGWFLVKGQASEALVRDVEPSVQRAQALLDALPGVKKRIGTTNFRSILSLINLCAIGFR